MNLTGKEEAMLNGEKGEGAQKAMEIVVALAGIYGAERLVAVGSVQVAGVSYKNLGDAGIEFLEEWAGQGARVSVPTTLNPAGMDLDEWKEIGFDEEFAMKQNRVIDAFGKLGIPPSCSCTPYLTGNIPRYGEHIAWAESSAVAFSNSVLGARTNREGGPSAIAAAVTGRTGEFGFHLHEKRISSYLVEVNCEMNSEADFGALGYHVGKLVKKEVPYYRGIRSASIEQLKALGAASAASGAVALYHIEGITPEAMNKEMLAAEHETITVETLKEAYDALNSEVSEIDFVSLGCPHASIEELKRVVDLIGDRKLTAALWITTAKQTKALAERMGIVQRIRAAGGHVLSDTCLVVAPVEHFGYKNLATNTGKGAFYAPSHSKLNVRFGTTEQCIEAAVTGRWPA